MSQFHSWHNQDDMQLLQQQLLHKPNQLGQISIPNVTNERILPQNFQFPLATNIQSFPEHLNKFQNNPFHVGTFLPEHIFSQEYATNYQHSSGLTSLDPTEEKILFGSDDDVSSSARVISQGNNVTKHGCLGNISSINSGSWSALMQEAVEASSSETGLHEEWSSLSFQKPEESFSNNSSILTTNQLPNFVVNEGHKWNFSCTAVSHSKDLFNDSAQYSSVISENLQFTKDKKNKGMEEELKDQHAFPSNCSDGASFDPLANLCSLQTTPQTSQSMVEPNCKAEIVTSKATDPPGITKSATADSTSHKNLPFNQISLQNQFISNQPLSHYQYPSVHLNPKQPQKDHYSSQSNIVDSNEISNSPNTLYDLFGFTKMVSKTFNDPSKSVNENSLGAMVNNLWNISSVQQNLPSIDPTKISPSIFQPKMEGDEHLTGIAKNSTNSLDQDQKQDLYDKARMPSFSSDETRNVKEYSYFSSNAGSASRLVQGNTCLKDTTLLFDSKSPKRGYDGGAHDARQRPKKQKADVSPLISWSRVVDGSHQRSYNVRIKEHGWTQATNRLIEKVEDIAKLKEDVPSEAQNRKRLILTTQLTEQLFPGLQFKCVIEDATLAYKNITYCVARSALEEACTLISSADNSSLHANPADRIHQNISDNSAGGSSLSEAVENIMLKLSILESCFLRLDKRSSVVDLKLMWQELERYAIVSYLGKFHTQGRHVNPESTPNSQTAPRRHLAQGHATLVVWQIDTAPLHGDHCLSL